MQIANRPAGRPVTMQSAWPLSGLFGPTLAPDGAIPDNAIYANGEPIPDPSGTGYLTYEV